MFSGISIQEDMFSGISIQEDMFRKTLLFFSSISAIKKQANKPSKSVI
jgi:hypothetical protein